jgi:hypothetical protein
MTLKELKDWLDKLPDEYSDFTVVNGEEGILDGKYWYRLDKPIVTLMIDEDEQEIIMLNDSEKPLSTEDIKEDEHTD